MTRSVRTLICAAAASATRERDRPSRYGLGVRFFVALRGTGPRATVKEARCPGHRSAGACPPQSLPHPVHPANPGHPASDGTRARDRPSRYG